MALANKCRVFRRVIKVTARSYGGAAVLFVVLTWDLFENISLGEYLHQMTFLYVNGIPFIK